MPQVSRFFGIVITMYHDEHPPPPFHARYGSAKIVVNIADGRVTGKLPPRAMGLVLEWWSLHQAELGENWQALTEGREARKIAPLDVVAVRHLHDYVLWLRFEDGTEGEVDLRESLRGPVFEPLKDVEYFKRVRVDPELGTVTWPNGADVAPEILYKRVRVSV